MMDSFANVQCILILGSLVFQGGENIAGGLGGAVGQEGSTDRISIWK